MTAGPAPGALLQACLNGARRPSDHPALPVTADQLAADAARALAAGAGAVHAHAKDAEGADTLDGAAVAALVVAVRGAAPGAEVGVSTGAWAAPDPASRVAAVRAWPVLPDVASVNWHEEGADDVAAALLERDVGVEAGLWHRDAVAAWAASPHRDRCRRVLLEIGDGPDAAQAAVEAQLLLGLVAAAQGRGSLPVLVHGEGSSCWPVLRWAACRGLAVRMGLEDVLTLPDGDPAPGNTALVRAARRIVDRADAC